MNHTRQRIFLVMVAVFVFHQAGTLPAEEREKAQEEGFSGVHFREGRLRVAVENQKFRDLMEEVSIETGIRIVVDKSDETNVTVRFDYLPLEEGLKKLVSGRNHILVYSSEAPSGTVRVKQVYVLSGTKGKMAAQNKAIENESIYGTGPNQTGITLRNVDQKSLEELLQALSQSGTDVSDEIMEEIKGLEKLGEEFSKTLEMMQKMEGFKKRTAGDKPEKRLPLQP